LAGKTALITDYVCWEAKAIGNVCPLPLTFEPTDLCVCHDHTSFGFESQGHRSRSMSAWWCCRSDLDPQSRTVF